MPSQSIGRVGRIGAVVAVIVAAWMTQPAAFAAEGPSLSKVKLAIPLTVLAESAGVEAAIKAGYAKDEGLQIEFVRFRSWTEPVQAIASGAAQFAFGAASLIRAAVGSNAPVRQIAMVSSRYPYDFWVTKQSGIKSIAGLRGKKIQTVRVGETLDNVWVQVLAGAGMTSADVQRVESFNGFGSLLSGTVDAANLSSVEIGKARKAGFVEILDYTEWRKEHNLAVDGGENLGWGTSIDLLRNHPDTVRAFLRALVRGTVRLREDKPFALSVLEDEPYSLDPETAAEVYARHRDHWMVRMDTARGDFAFDVRMTEIAMGRPEGSIDVKSVSDSGAIDDVLRALKVSF